MPFPDELLNPIEGSNPSGVNLRYTTTYDTIKEARREDAVAPGTNEEERRAHERERKVANNPLVIKLTTDALSTKTKDLQLAVWLTEALLKERGLAGLRDGLIVCNALIEKFWDTLYPEVEDGDLQFRAAPIESLEGALFVPLMNVPLFQNERYGLADLRYAREVVQYEQQVKDNTAKQSRDQAIKEGKLSPEAFDKLFEGSFKVFYVTTEKLLDECLQILGQLRHSCEVKFPDADVRPSTHRLQSALEDVRHVVHGFLEKKREKEPDPVEALPPAAVSDAASIPSAEPAVPSSRVGAMLVSLESSSESPDRVEAVRKIAEAASFLRRREPHSPAAYLLIRGLRWGELRAAVDQCDPTLLEAPPTELRTHLKRLQIDKKWEDLLEAAENAMALPCSRAWLDLQRLVIEACEALGTEYDAIAKAIRSELKALVTDLPRLLDATLMDDMPAANSKTRAWLKSLVQDVNLAPLSESPASLSPANDGLAASWPGRPSDVYATAVEVLHNGQERRAFQMLHEEIARQRSGRERFRRKMQLVEICALANKLNIAQPVLDDLAAAIENHKLDDWEDPSMVAGTLARIMKLSQRIQADKVQQQKLFERICRLDSAHVLENGN